MSMFRWPALILALSTALPLALTFCGGGTAKPTATAVATQTAAPPFAQKSPGAATFTSRAGASLIVYLRAGDLWIASLDGTTVPPRAITTGAIKSGFSGLMKREDGGEDLYYMVQLSDQRLAGDRYEADFGLYRVPLAGGTPSELLRYTGRPLEPFITPNAAVSPDGKHVLYADNDGIALLDLASGHSKRLLANSPPCRGPAGCFAYHHPRWSPAGDRALVTKTLWEGAQDVIIDPLASSVSQVNTKGGGSFTARLSPDGQKVCASESTYANAGAVMIYDVASGATTDSTLGLGLPTPTQQYGLRIDARGCAWSADGRLAIGYIVPDKYKDVRVAILDASYAVLAQSDPIPNLVEVVAWLPDGSGVLFNRTLTTGQPVQAGIYRPDAGVSDLPFEADTILAVVP